MKLNTLLLTSAATLMATSVAFAADLPSKKAAPAAGSVQVCKVGGMTGFTIPGSDTCLGISGHVRANFEYDMTDGMNGENNDGALDWDNWAGSARLNFDARSNSEVGVVRSYIRLGDGGAEQAYLQFGGVTAGLKPSIADILGTKSINFTRSSVGDSSGVDYQVNVGGLNLGIGAEAPINNAGNKSTAGVGTQLNALVSDRPDIVGHISGSFAPVSFAFAAVSHEAHDENAGGTAVGTAGTDQGYAFLGNVTASVGTGVSVYGFGAMATNASGYTGGSGATYTGTGTWSPAGVNKVDALYDNDGADLDTTMLGIGAAFTQGKITIGAEYAQYTAEQAAFSIDTDAWAVYGTYAIAKNLSATVEYYTIEASDNAGNTGGEDTLYVRIQRDF